MSPADRPIDPAGRHALLPAADALREALHNEVHARPPARITLPALVVHIAVLNEGVPREAEAAHLRLLPGQQGLAGADLQANFLQVPITQTAYMPAHECKGLAIGVRLLCGRWNLGGQLDSQCLHDGQRRL